LDEYNFGGIQLACRERSQGATGWNARPIVLSVVSGWSMKNYLASEIAQGYFRAIIGRYSKDVMHKQLKVRKEVASIYDESAEERNARIQEEACLETVIDVHDSSCRRDFQG
jgi:hypothetical protein